ncbi:hypothetical protein BDZ89DRAFT_1067475 [Hymenopellis radicata]|nr:hypothetical protein BDZ89DRAFT_1067475 [Hymenopellis radicata]
MMLIPDMPASGGSIQHEMLHRQSEWPGYGRASSEKQFRSSANFGPAMTSSTKSTSSASEEPSFWSHHHEIFPTTIRDPDPWADFHDDDGEMFAIVGPSGLEDFHARYPRRERANSDCSLTDATRAGAPPVSSRPDYMAALEEFRTEGEPHRILFQRLSQCQNVRCRSDSIGSHNVCPKCLYISCAGCRQAKFAPPRHGPHYFTQRTSCCSFARAVVLLQILEGLDRVVQSDVLLIDEFMARVVKKENLQKVVAEQRLSIVSTETVGPFNDAVRDLLHYDLLGGADLHESVSFLIRRSFMPLLVHLLLHDLKITEHEMPVYDSGAKLLMAFLSAPSLQDILIEPFITVVSRAEMGLHEWYRQNFPPPKTRYDLNVKEGDKMFHCQELDLGQDIALVDVIVRDLESMGASWEEVADLWKTMMRMWIGLFDERKKALPVAAEGHRRKYLR